MRQTISMDPKDRFIMRLKCNFYLCTCVFPEFDWSIDLIKIMAVVDSSHIVISLKRESERFSLHFRELL